jgi:hypothetical protein
VYRAHDVELRREVAPKVLPESLLGDGQRLALFRPAWRGGSTSLPNNSGAVGSSTSSCRSCGAFRCATSTSACVKINEDSDRAVSHWRAMIARLRGRPPSFHGAGVARRTFGRGSPKAARTAEHNRLSSTASRSLVHRSSAPFVAHPVISGISSKGRPIDSSVSGGALLRCGAQVVTESSCSPASCA